MIKIIKNVSGGELTITDLKLTLSNNEEFAFDESGWANSESCLVTDDFINSVDTLQAITDTDLQVGDGTNWYSGKEAELYLKSKFDDDSFVLDGSTIQTFTPQVVTDPTSGKKALSTFMNVLTMMKEFYNAVGSPLYDAAFQPFIGAGGREQQHLDSTANLNSIHSKTGWHRQEVTQASYLKPQDLLIYYGYPNAFNSGVNSWNNELVAQDMAKYNHVILGDTVQESSHPDYSNSQVIIPRVQALNQYLKVWGYVTINQTLANFKTQVDEWNTLAVDGIFLDECGYDYGKNRDEFNEMVDYVHGKSVSKLCFANAWNMDHIIGTANDVSYPNTTYNHFEEESNLTSNDWYLLESFPINTTAYSGNDGYDTKSNWASRGSKAITHRYNYGINLASVGIINNANGSGQELFDFQFISALMWALDANGTSDTSYASSSSEVTFWSRPNISNMGRLWVASTSPQIDVGDADIYWRFIDFGKFMLDFSSSAQASSITKFLTTSESSVYGTEHQEASVDGESTHSSSTFQQKLRMTTGTLPSGKYRIGWSYEWQSQSTNQDFRGQIQINDTTTIQEHQQESQDTGNDQWSPTSGFYYYTGSGVLNIDIDYATSASSTVGCRRARLEIFRIS